MRLTTNHKATIAADTNIINGNTTLSASCTYLGVIASYIAIINISTKNKTTGVDIANITNKIPIKVSIKYITAFQGYFIIKCIYLQYKYI